MFGEFAAAGTDMLDAHLASAELEVSDAFGDSRDLAVYLKMADGLALSPWGRDARMVTEDQRTSTYGTRYWSMCRVNAVSASRLGSR